MTNSNESEPVAMTPLRIRSSLTPLILLFAALLAASTPVWADAETARAQRQLVERGFDPGPVDGLMGPRTHAAIRDFQRDRGLAVSGRLDQKTRDALFAPAAASMPSDAAAVKAPAAAPETGAEKSAGPPPEAQGTAPEPPPAEPAAPARSAARGVLSFEALGWEPPQGGPDALTRFRKNAGSPEMARSTEELIVPRGGSIYVVAAGERIPGFDCDPLSGRIEMELMLGMGGPIVFRALDDRGFCKLGFGILLEVGQRLRIAGTAWGEETIRSGIVKVVPEGLRYVSGD